MAPEKSGSRPFEGADSVAIIREIQEYVVIRATKDLPELAEAHEALEAAFAGLPRYSRQTGLEREEAIAEQAFKFALQRFNTISTRLELGYLKSGIDAAEAVEELQRRGEGGGAMLAIILRQDIAVTKHADGIRQKKRALMGKVSLKKLQGREDEAYFRKK